ncbi:MAG: hypothetical protein ACFFAH_12740 [Promethearchaeota archaeon]
MKANKEQNQDQIHRITYLVFLLSPLIYLFILIILHFGVSPRKGNGITQNIIFLILIIYIFCISGNILLTYLVFIPLARKFEDKEVKLGINILIIANGSSVISVYGLILGILWWTGTGVVPFWLILPFIAFSLIHGYYLYKKYIIKKKME